MSERIALLIRAAREVQSPQLRDELLAAAEAEASAKRGRPRTSKLDDPGKVKFPLGIFVIAPDGKEVKATLNEDASVVMEGEEFSSPSSSPLMTRVGFKPGNAWPRWRFEAEDGKTLPIQVLRDAELIKQRRG